VGLGLENKRILKREAARQFSKALVYRPKVGFGVPLGRWFRAERRFREVLASLYEPNSFVSSLIPRRIIQTVVIDHCELGHDRTAVLWLLINLEVWGQVMLKAPRPAGN
jgi:asparagine synthase (glutamine-hydrolysing)